MRPMLFLAEFKLQESRHTHAKEQISSNCMPYNIYVLSLEILPNQLLQPQPYDVMIFGPLF